MFISSTAGYFYAYTSPVSLNSGWGFGSNLGVFMCLFNIVAVGMLLVLLYKPSAKAFSEMVYGFKLLKLRLVGFSHHKQLLVFYELSLALFAIIFAVVLYVAYATVIPTNALCHTDIPASEGLTATVPSATAPQTVTAAAPQEQSASTTATAPRNVATSRNFTAPQLITLTLAVLAFLATLSLRLS